jgi:hypothetical protein
MTLGQEDFGWVLLDREGGYYLRRMTISLCDISPSPEGHILYKFTDDILT